MKPYKVIKFAKQKPKWFSFFFSKDSWKSNTERKRYAKLIIKLLSPFMKIIKLAIIRFQKEHVRLSHVRMPFPPALIHITRSQVIL